MPQGEAGEGREEESPDFLKEELVELDEHEDEDHGPEDKAGIEQEPSEGKQQDAAEETDAREIDDALEEVKEEVHEREAEAPRKDEKVSPEEKPEEPAEEEGTKIKKSSTESEEAKDKRKGKGKKFLIYGVGLLLLGSVAVFAAKAFIPNEKDAPREKKIILKPVERLVIEEKLEPFFVPLPGGQAKRKRPRVMAYVEVTAKWEKIVSAQFKENKPKVRADFYWVLVKFMKEGGNPRDMKGHMAKALTEAAKKTLGVSNVEMRVENVKII